LNELGQPGELQLGDVVRLILATGEKIDGEFIASHRDGIDVLVSASGTDVKRSRTFAWNRIACIEKHTMNMVDISLVILGAGVLAYTVAESPSRNTVELDFGQNQ
jgi:hypothetical protein